jgi:hypothetical protein
LLRVSWRVLRLRMLAVKNSMKALLWALAGGCDEGVPLAALVH